MMKKLLSALALVCFLGGVMHAQQDPMYTKYMFNTLVFNPAYAGNNEFMTIGVLHRSQWINFDGAPTTQTATLHTPLKNERVGVGLSLFNDVIGPTNNMGANLSYAYRIPFGDKARLSIGLQMGVENFTADWTQLSIESPDPSFEQNVSKFQPNFGAGIYFQAEKFYIGASVPHLVEYDRQAEIASGSVPDAEIFSRQFRHFYFMGGAAFELNGPDLVFKPSMLVKAVGLDKSFSKDPAFENIGAPLEADLDLSLLFYQTFWVGASFRSAFDTENSSVDSGDIWVSYFLNNGLRVGMAYDYPLNEIRDVSFGSFEVFLGYELNFKERNVVTPRYF